MKDKDEYKRAKSTTRITPGESVKMIRELQGLSQAELADKAGIPQPTISGIETGRIKLGAERAKTLARALRVHPAVLLRLADLKVGAPP